MIKKFSLFSKTNADDLNSYSAKVYPVSAYSELLDTPMRKKIISKIKTNLGTSENYYKVLHRPIIDNLAHYLQNLPDIRTYETEHARLWLDSALIRCAYTTTIRHHLTLPLYGNITEIRQNYALWTYVVFSASLLWQIGKISANFVIGICNNKGQVSKQWRPLVQSLYMAGEHYKIQYIDKTPNNKYRSITPVLARILMPNDGFDWIADNDQALEYWLNALVEEGSAQGKLVYILSLTDKFLMGVIGLDEFLKLLNLDLNLEKYHKLKEDLKEIRDLSEQLDNVNFPPVKFTEPPDTAIGEKFLEWLRRGLKDKTISYNKPDSHVHIQKDGIILLYPAIFKEFSQNFHLYKDWIVVYKQFNMLGITRKGSSDTWFTKFFVDTDELNPGNKKEIDGIMINNTKAVYGNLNMPISKYISSPNNQIEQSKQNMPNLQSMKNKPKDS